MDRQSVRKTQLLVDNGRGREMSDTKFRRVSATVMKRFARTFEGLAAYDRGEYQFPRK